MESTESRLVRLSRRLNAIRGGQFPHLTICAELWVLDRRLQCHAIDFIMLIIWWETAHCKKQYLTHDINQRTLHGLSDRTADPLDQTAES